MRRETTPFTADILHWAEPLVRDRLAAFWERETNESEAARPLCDLHWRVWRCALSDLPHGAAASRRDLADRVVAAGLPAHKVAQGDEVVIDELAEVIVARFRRSPALAKDYTKALVLTAASLLAPSGAVKAA